MTPLIGGVAQPPIVSTWARSPHDPDNGTSIVLDAAGADIGLATHAFGAAPRATQVEGIWGAGTTLPGRDAGGHAYTSYRISFDYELHSHDARGSSTVPQAMPPVGAALQWTVVAAVLLARRPLLAAR